MATRKKAWKLQDFVAHSADVRCLGLGHKGGQVMVTGGDDNKLNLWSVGKPDCIMSLTSHIVNFESVRFSPDEEMVVAGSLSGVLKAWNLTEAKIMRTLSGHKAAIKSLDFHPYGHYVASGSMDCSVKLWDIRRKGCIYTYKSHTMCVNSLRFTPDGQWIASAGEDGVIKIWDLTAGKNLAELKQHKGPVNTLEFHPSELLLASGSSDKSVKFWELESFQCVSSSDQDKQPVRSIYFHPEGSCLFSACGDTLKVYGWEPFICHDVVPVQWSEVADMAICRSQLVAASFNGKNNVSTYVVDLTKVAPIGVDSKSTYVRENLQSSSGRRSFKLDPQTSSKQISELKRSETPPDKSSESNDVESSEDSVSRADIKDQDNYKKFFKDNADIRDRVEPFQAPSEDDVSESSKSSSSKPKSVGKEVSPPAAKTSAQKPERGVQAADFLPKSRLQGEQSEKETLNLLETSHPTMLTVLGQRSKSLMTVLEVWKTGNQKTAIDSAISMNDPAVMVDLLNILNTKSTSWDLDLCRQVLPQLKDLMGSKYESHLVTATDSVRLILRSFGDVIKANMEEPTSSFVDINREERHKKCLACYSALSSIKALIKSHQSPASTKLSSAFKEIMVLMARLE